MSSIFSLRSSSHCTKILITLGNVLAVHVRSQLSYDMEKFTKVYGPLTESDYLPIAGVSDDERASVSVVSQTYAFQRLLLELSDLALHVLEATTFTTDNGRAKRASRT